MNGRILATIGLIGTAAIFRWQRRHYQAAFLAGLWAPLVALSRVYLGVHYPSDVLASLAAGTIWLILVMFVFEHAPTKLSDVINTRHHFLTLPIR